MIITRGLSRLMRMIKRDHPSKTDVSFQLLVEHSADVICRIEQGHFIYLSPSAEKIFGWNTNKLVGSNAIEKIHPDDRAMMKTLIDAAILQREASLSIRSRVLCSDGSSKWCEANIAPYGNQVNGDDAVLVIRDISERVMLEEELKSLAQRDGLTGLKNRRSFDQILEQEFCQAMERDGLMSILLIDVDHFKLFNDTYGHQDGDECLQAVARSLEKQMTAPGHSALRYGGEEFAVILRDADLMTAIDTAKTICRSIEDLKIPHEQSSCGNHVTVSIGVFALGQSTRSSVVSSSDLVRLADKALYNAKLEGRNRVSGSAVDVTLFG